MSEITAALAKLIMEVKKVGHVKSVKGKMIYKNSFSEAMFSIWVDVQNPERKTLTIYSASIDVPDIQLSVDDVIDAIYQAYRKSNEVTE